MTSLALRRNAVRICPANTLAPLLVLSLLPPLRSAGAECGATCGGPLTADRESEGYSGSCWENDLIMAIPLLQCARLAMPYRAPRPSEGSWPTPALLALFFGLSAPASACAARGWPRRSCSRLCLGVAGLSRRRRGRGRAGWSSRAVRTTQAEMGAGLVARAGGSVMKKILAKKLASVLPAYSHTAFAHCPSRLSVIYCAPDPRDRISRSRFF